MHWYLEVWKKFGVFSGRAHRTEYWMFVLFNVVISIAITLIEGLTGFTTSSGYGIVSSLYGLFVIIPSIGVGVRRLHDTGRSGFWMLISFIPCIGAIVLLVFFVQDSQPDRNQYGRNPKD